MSMSNGLRRSALLFVVESLLIGGAVTSGLIGGLSSAGAAAPSEVLATVSANGPSVTVGDVLTQNLVLTGPDIGCTSGSAQETVLSNPASPAVADLNMTDVAFSGCTATSDNFPMTLTADGLPYSPLTISDTSGDQVGIGSTSFTAVIDAGALGTYTCSLASSGMTGTWSNDTNAMSFSDQDFTASGDRLCSDVAISITLGPVVDSSANGSPAVYVTNLPFTPSSPTISNGLRVLRRGLHRQRLDHGGRDHLSYLFDAGGVHCFRPCGQLRRSRHLHIGCGGGCGYRLHRG